MPKHHTVTKVRQDWGSPSLSLSIGDRNDFGILQKVAYTQIRKKDIFILFMTIVMDLSISYLYFCSHEAHGNSFGRTHHVGQAPLADYGICEQLRLHRERTMREQGQTATSMQRQMLPRQTIGAGAERSRQKPLWGTKVQGGSTTCRLL